jgi:hypothetical protein
LRAGTAEFIRQVEEKTGKALWNNGAFGVRNMRSKKDLSVHSTGRAVDLSYRMMKDGRGQKGGRRKAQIFMDWMAFHSEQIGLELCIDYAVPRYGRAWKCDRQGWKRFTKPTVAGGGSLSSDWIHVELSPKAADDPEMIRTAFEGFDSAPFEG